MLAALEDQGYRLTTPRRSIINLLDNKEEGFSAEGISLNGQDKRGRLMLTTALLQNGQILFPEKGAEELIRQLVGFGAEKHDDLVDAFSLLILQEIKYNYSGPQIRWI